ncbi:unnamed protein product [Acanthoscelides obtectus]|uniref:EF-hand domain-containing protein n=1 Tax=Acanthoscelides obtectus TaxID=200917 RepID=A0A9P0LAB0_ACAOB|nr:unnamed protein product [Acanthoscelides obtectus]CAK1650076.1 hypothetical protein AOBTE_LOCUS16586 [Acanthoscelides obtectus]
MSNPWYNRISCISRSHITNIIGLRMGQGSYKQHQYRIDIVNNPYRECGHIEDINHIFLKYQINKTNNITYDELRRSVIPTPLNMQVSLQNITKERMIIIINFINKYKLAL